MVAELTSTAQGASGDFAYFPVIPGSKMPAIKDWQNVTPGMYPRGSGGISLQPDQLVIDADPRNYPPGRDVLAEMMESYQFPNTRIVKTPRGGYHFYFRKPAAIKVRKEQSRWKGVDFLSAGAFVIEDGWKTKAGEKTADGVYVLVLDCPVAEIPAALLLDLEAPAERASEGAEVSLEGYAQFKAHCEGCAPATEGQNGDAATFKVACDGRDLALPLDVVFRLMRDYFNPRCQPPWSDGDLYKKVENAFSYAKNAAGAKLPGAQFPEPQAPPEQAAASQNDEAAQNEKIIAADGIDLWRDEDHIAYGTIFNTDHFEHYPIQSKAFRLIYIRRYAERVGKIPSKDVVSNGVNYFESKALMSESVSKAWLRVARLDNKIYVDLCNSKWQAVEIDDQGWRVIDRPPVKFVRTNKMKELPAPVDQDGPEALNKLRGVFNFADENSWALFVGALVSYFNVGYPVPMVFLNGPPGTFKTAVLRLARQLVDPVTDPERTPPKDEESMMVTARSNYFCSWDNLSKMPDWFSDGLCRLATGGSLGRRENYTNADEFSYRVLRPVIISSVDSLVVRNDVAERSVFPRLVRVHKSKRRTEQWLNPQIQALLSRVLGALYSAVSCALRCYEELPEIPRMADFFCFAVAAEKEGALGFPAGTFSRAYAQNELEASQEILDANPIGQHVRMMGRSCGKLDMLKQPCDKHRCVPVGEAFVWTGTATEFLESAYNNYCLPKDARERLPKRANWAINYLNGVVPALEQIGFTVSVRRDGTGCKIKIEREPITWKDLT